MLGIILELQVHPITFIKGAVHPPFVHISLHPLLCTLQLVLQVHNESFPLKVVCQLHQWKSLQEHKEHVLAVPPHRRLQMGCIGLTCGTTYYTTI